MARVVGKARESTAGRSTSPRRTLADEAHFRLRNAIIQCGLRPGARVSETDLVRVSSVGKTPVRDAVARLVQEGLVRSIPHHGYEIAPITLHDVQEVFAMRVTLEGIAAQLAAGHVDAARLRQLDRLCVAASRKLKDPGSFNEHMRANHEFHVSIAEATGNQRLTDAISRLMDESERMFRLAVLLQGDTSGVRHHHRELVDALLAGDSQAARRITTDQLLDPERMIIEALIHSPSLRATHVVAEPPRAALGESRVS